MSWCIFDLGGKWHIQQAKTLGKQNTLPLLLDSKVAALNKPHSLTTEESFDEQQKQTQHSKQLFP